MQDDSQPSLVRELIDMFQADSGGHGHDLHRDALRLVDLGATRPDVRRDKVGGLLALLRADVGRVLRPDDRVRLRDPAISDGRRHVARDPHVKAVYLGKDVHG